MFLFHPTCFSLSFDVLHTVINSLLVQTFRTAQVTPALTDSFSRGHDPFAHACQARPLTIVGWTSLSVSLSLSLSLSLAEKNAEKVWKTKAWATYEGDVPVTKASRSTLRWRTSWWWNSSAWGMRSDPVNVSVETHMGGGGGPQQGRGVGHTDGKMAGRRKGLDTGSGLEPAEKS